MKTLIRIVLLAVLFMPIKMNGSASLAGFDTDPPKKKNIIKRAYSAVKKAFGRSNSAPARAQIQIGAPTNFKRPSKIQLGNQVVRRSVVGQRNAGASNLKRTWTPPPLPPPPSSPPPAHLLNKANGSAPAPNSNYGQIPKKLLMPPGGLGPDNKRPANSNYGKVPSNSNYGVLPERRQPVDPYGIVPKERKSEYSKAPGIQKLERTQKVTSGLNQQAKKAIANTPAGTAPRPPIPPAEQLQRTTSSPSIPGAPKQKLTRTNSVNNVQENAKKTKPIITSGYQKIPSSLFTDQKTPGTAPIPPIPPAEKLKRSTTVPSIPGANKPALNRTNSVNGVKSNAIKSKPLVPPAPKSGPVKGPKPPVDKAKASGIPIPPAPKMQQSVRPPEPKMPASVKKQYGNGKIKVPPAPKMQQPVRPPEPKMPASVKKQYGSGQRKAPATQQKKTSTGSKAVKKTKAVKPSKKKTFKKR